MPDRSSPAEDTLSDIVAERKLDIMGRRYSVVIERPRPDVSGDFFCRWSLSDDSDAPILTEKTYGVDTLQALIAALLVMGEAINAKLTNGEADCLTGEGFLRRIEFTSGTRGWVLS